MVLKKKDAKTGRPRESREGAVRFSVSVPRDLRQTFERAWATHGGGGISSGVVEALRLWLSLRPSTSALGEVPVSLSLSLSPDVREALERLAKGRGLSISALLMEMARSMADPLLRAVSKG